MNREELDGLVFWTLGGEIGFLDDLYTKLFMNFSEHYDAPITLHRYPPGHFASI